MSEPLAFKAYLAQAYQEPYRLLFPMGILLGLFGVALWPLYYTGWFPIPYPVPHHAHIMIQGFFGSFVFGFLGTAMPRMLTAPTLRPWEVGVFMSLLLLTVTGHMAGHSQLGNGSFLLLLLSFMFIMRSRFVARQDVPPPGFILVIMGWSSAVVASTILLLTPYVSVSIFWYQLAKLLLFQGFLLFPIMGIGAFLFPRFFGLPNLQDFDESRALPPGWKRKAAFAGLCGLIVMFGFVLEARSMVRAGPIFRLIGVAIYFGREVPFFSTFKNHGTLGVCLGTALLTLMTGMICQAAFPQYAIAMEHIILVGGFGLLTLTVATRVILGHGGQTHRFKAKIRPLGIMMILVIAALTTRMIADILPEIRVSHQVYAAILWIAAILTWAIKILPGVLQTDDDPQ